MIDYARVSKIIEYSKTDCIPFGGYRGYRRYYNKIKQILNFIPLLNELYGEYSFLVGGTRVWEYPWVFDIISKYASKNSTILDCGCGRSYFPQYLSNKGYSVYGLDHAEQIKNLRGNKNLKYIEGDMSDIPFEDSTFDVVTCIPVMEHIVYSTKNNPNFHYKCLEEMKRVLKPSGILICTYDTWLNKKHNFAGVEGWGINGWNFLDDIKFLNMDYLNKNQKEFSFEDIILDDDLFIINPSAFYKGWGKKEYIKVTSVGFALKKKI